MCGIAGFWGKGNQATLAAMTETIKYRGPDDQGHLVLGPVGLGHQRLSILDLSPAGHQPMTNEDQSLHIVFNGEIYNYQSLKKTLKEPHHFKGTSDTEVILHLYEEIGEKVFEHLNGMFAIALYDTKTQRLILARDRLGKKPLYYGLFGNTLVFGSELKALLKHPVCARELDLESLNKYLLFEYVPTPHTIFKNIKKLEPGSTLTFNGTKIEQNIFWDVPVKNANKYKTFSLKEAINELDQKINTAVVDRLVSDVPLGIFLSGGIDSSTIAYYAKQHVTRPLKTFSIGFTESSFDESVYARKVAKFLGTEHYEKILKPTEAVDLVPQIAALLDEPLADPSIVPTFLLSQFTREKVTVALGGDGGDELFAGYDPFRAEQYAKLYERVPQSWRQHFIEPIINHLPASFNNLSFDFKAKKFISGFSSNKKYRHHLWLGSFDQPARSSVLAPEIWAQLNMANEFQDIDAYLARIPQASYEDQNLYLYLRTYLLDDILVKVDRASMYNSLEVRAPLLDYKLVEYVTQLPYNFKIQGNTTKFILKKLMENKLPHEIVYRKKKGFGMPVARWLNGALRPICEEVFTPSYLKKQGIFNEAYVHKLWSDHQRGQTNNYKLLWTLLMFQLWYKNWYPS